MNSETALSGHRSICARKELWMRQMAVLVVLSATVLSLIIQAGGAQEPVVTTPIATRAIATLTIPGYVDFLAPDGRAVWSTNEGRVEKLQHDRPSPVAVVAVPALCGAMAVAFGSLWVASPRRERYRSS